MSISPAIAAELAFVLFIFAAAVVIDQSPALLAAIAGYIQ